MFRAVAREVPAADDVLFAQASWIKALGPGARAGWPGPWGLPQPGRGARGPGPRRDPEAGRPPRGAQKGPVGF